MKALKFEQGIEIQNNALKSNKEQKHTVMHSCQTKNINIVTTLALGSRPRQCLVRLRAKREAGSEGKCEGMNPHTLKGAPTLGVGVSMDSRIFRERL
jgi:hypothetical protein